MSDKITKAQKVSEEIIPVDEELSDNDLEAVSGGHATAIGQGSAFASAQDGISVAVGIGVATAVDINLDLDSILPK